MVQQTLNYINMDWVSLFRYLGIVCQSLLAVVGFCNVWFAADDDPDLRVRIRPLWLQRVCRFFLVTVGVLLLWMDVIFQIPDEDAVINALEIIEDFFFAGVLLLFFAFVFYAFCIFVAWCLKQLAKYIWNE